MSQRYGQAITWGTVSAPHLYTSDAQAYSYLDQLSEQLLDDEKGDQEAVVLTHHKAEISFDGEVTSGSTNWLDLSGDNANIVVSGISGIVLARNAVETWRLGQRKRASVQATYYPDISQTSPASAGTSTSAFTPDQSGLSTVTPGAAVIYGTYGLGHAAGVIHELTLAQELEIIEDEVDPDGTIKGATATGYLRRVTISILAKSTIPATGSKLALTGGPAMITSNFLIKSASQRFVKKRGKMYDIDCVWIPPLA